MDCLDLSNGQCVIRRENTTRPTLITEARFKLTKGWAAELSLPRDRCRYDLGREFLKSERTGLVQTYTLCRDGVYEADAVGRRVYFRVERGVISLLRDKHAAKRVLRQQPTDVTPVDAVPEEPAEPEAPATLGSVLNRPNRWF